MRTRKTLMALAATLLVGASGLARAADKLDIGKREYESNCAACHGLTGKADVSYAEILRTPIPNLTVLAKKNGGVFPFQRVYEVIDGREEIRAHGRRDMPIWGSDYNQKVAPEYDDYLTNREVYVRSRILALTEYIYRLQAK